MSEPAGVETTPHDAARAEAERAFPADLPLYRFDDLELYVSGVRDSDIREHQQDAFVKGAEWGRADERARIAARRDEASDAVQRARAATYPDEPTSTAIVDAVLAALGVAP